MPYNLYDKKQQLEAEKLVKIKLLFLLLPPTPDGKQLSSCGRNLRVKMIHCFLRGIITGLTLFPNLQIECNFDLFHNRARPLQPGHKQTRLDLFQPGPDPEWDMINQETYIFPGWFLKPTRWFLILILPVLIDHKKETPRPGPTTIIQ